MRRLLPLIAVAVLTAPAYAQTRWTLIRSETLTVLGDQARTVREVATEIERFREVVGQLVGTARPPAVPTVVYVFNTRKGMEPYLPLYNGRPLAAAGLYAPDVDVSRILMTSEYREQSTAIAYHEYTHLLVMNTVRGMPVWLNEGLAEYFSTFRMTGGRAAEAGHPKAPHILLLREQFIPIAELLETQHSSKLYNEGDRRNIFYAESWALTHYILSEPNGPTSVNKFIKLVNAGATPAEAVRDAFGTTPAALESRLRSYVQRELFSVMRYDMSQRVAATQTSAPQTLSALEVEGWLGNLQRGVRGPEAAAARIEAAAAQGPDVAIVQLALGRLRARQNRPDDARAALARAAAAAPDDFIMQLAHGMWLAHSGGQLVSTDDVIASLRRATALNPESAEAHAWLAVNLMTSPATRGEARAAIDRAIKLAPGRLDYVVHLANIYLLDELIAPARALLNDVVAVGRDEHAVASARARLSDLAAREQLRARREAVEAEFAAAAAALNADRAGAAPAAGDVREPGGVPEASTPSRARPGAVNLSTLRAAYAATPLVHAGTGEQLILMMRRVRAGEQRVFATLTSIECRQGPEIRFHLTDGSKAIVATAGRFPDVELTAFRPGELMLGCGRRSPAERVALTFKPAANAAGIAGTALAVEFLPDGYGPPK